MNEPPWWAFKENSGFLIPRHIKPKPKSSEGFAMPPPTEQILSPHQAFFSRLSEGTGWKNILTLQRAPSWYNCWQNQRGRGDHSCRDEKEAEILHTPRLWHGLGLQKVQYRWKYLHLGPEETGYLPRAAKCADYKLLEESQLRNSTSLPLKPFSWPTCTSWLHFSLSEEWRTSWQIQAMCGTLPSWAAFQPARLWAVEPGLPAQCQAWRRRKVQCHGMWQWKACQDGQISAPHSSSDSLSSAMLIIHKLSLQ